MCTHNDATGYIIWYGWNDNSLECYPCPSDEAPIRMLGCSNILLSLDGRTDTRTLCRSLRLKTYLSCPTKRCFWTDRPALAYQLPSSSLRCAQKQGFALDNTLAHTPARLVARPTSALEKSVPETVETASACNALGMLWPCISSACGATSRRVVWDMP